VNGVDLSKKGVLHTIMVALALPMVCV